MVEAQASSSKFEPASDTTWQEPNLEGYLNDTIESINKLVKITRAIRQSSVHKRNPKVEAYEDIEAGPNGPINNSQNFEKFIGEFLEKRYRETNSNIRVRLQSAISGCRRRFAYRRRYQEKLKVLYGSAVLTETRSNTPNKPDHAVTTTLLHSTNNIVSANVQRNQTVAKLNAPSSHMTASTLRPDFRPFDTKSSVVSGSSFSRMSRDPRNDLPPVPSFKPSDRHFQCPYCFILLPRNKSESRAWR